MSYPESSDVSAGQPTASAHYNNLRKDALYLGYTSAQAVALGTLLSEYVQHLKLEYLATNRIRCPYDAAFPARIMVNGYMLYQGGTIDSALNLFSGGAATWYIFAQQNIGSKTFTLAVSTSATPAANQRLIGECLWDGSNVVPNSVRSYSQPQLAPADFDSGWFAVAYGNTYSKAHNFGSHPRAYKLFHCTAADGSGTQCEVGMVLNGTAYRGVIAATPTTFEVKTGSDAAAGTLSHMNGNSGGGYYRILAWR
jgi:hypothetical protein